MPKRVEVVDLVACMKGKDKRFRGIYFDNYCKRKPTLDALPVLREALLSGDHHLVKCAAVAIGKMKENAREAVPDLLAAAAYVDHTGLPQAYPECLNTLISVDKSCPEIIPLIKRFDHIDNWNPISASLKALAAIGNDEALEALQDIHDRWSPEFNKTQKRVADEILAEAKARRST
ncbi:hypothetical protein [Bremerella volcania]|uniref:hypothetical protein n=1 Tax=Bremerella volcania TaxID=2527984 RepID=UPI00119ECEE2|nr:hypothetical protein [Bremerella volcania]